MPQFVKDVEEIRQRAIHKIEDGPVTESYGVDKERAITILNEALATEIVCVLRYMHHYFMATGVHGRGVADEFKEHADAERGHADALAERIQQLGGKPDFNPRSLVERSASQYVEGESLADMIREDLIAERIVIEVYTEMIRFFGEKDPTTRRLIEDILTDEEEHAADLSDLLFVVDPRTGETEGQDPGTNPLHIRGRQMEGERAGVGGQVAAMPQRLGNRQQGGQVEKQGADQAVSASHGERGMTNREAAEELESGGLRRQAAHADRPAERGAELAPANEPGTRGRPTRKGNQEEVEADLGEINAGAETGATRAAHVTNPSRKRKKVA